MKANIACVQMKPELFNVKSNLDRMTAYIEKTMNEYPQTKLIIFPELITSGYECADKFQKLAETVTEGKSIDITGRLAQKYHVNIIFGFPERDQVLSDILYNSSVLISSGGDVLGVYRKVHLFASEKNYFRAGDDYPVFDTDIGKIGIMICWDTAFPEVARSYALQGVNLIAVSTNWEKPYEDDWDLITRARAFDNTVYLAAANRIGRDVELGFFGRSKIINPLGRPMQELNSETEGIIAAELDFELPRHLKAEYYTFFKDRRPDTYGRIAH